MMKWLWQIKWALVIAIVAGPAFSYFSSKERQRVEHIVAEGAAFPAFVDGVTVERHRRGGRTYKLHAVWTGESGVHYDHDFAITSQFANEIIADEMVTIDQVTVKYLPSETSDPMIVVEDAANEISNNIFNFWAGIAAGIAGLILSPIIFWLERRNAKSRDEDIDATLARMRAGQAQ